MAVDFGDSISGLIDDIEHCESECELVIKLADAMAERAEKLSSELKDAINELNSAKEDLESITNSLIEDAEQEIGKIRSAIAKNSDCHSALCHSVSEGQSRASIAIGEFTEHFKKAGDHGADTDESISDQFAQTLAELDTHSERMASSIEHLTRDFDQYRQEVAALTNTVVEEGEHHCTTIAETVLPTVRQQFSSTISDLETKGNEYNAAIIDSEKEFQDRISELLEECKEKHAGVIGDITDAVDDVRELADKIEKTVEDTSDVIEETTRTMNSAMEGSSVGLKTALGVLQELREVFEKVA